MSKTLQVRLSWFKILDKWHKGYPFHAREEGTNKSICGRQEINQVNQDSVIELETAANLPLKDLCGPCLRKAL